MIRSELIDRIAAQNPHLYARDVERVVGAILDRVVGRPKESRSIELTGKDGGALDMTHSELTTAEKIARADALAAARLAAGED